MLRKMLSAVQTKLVRLTDVPAHLELFFRDDEAPLPPDSQEKLNTEQARRAFAEFRQRLEGLDALNSDNFRELMKEVAKHTGVKGKSLWEPMRIALTLDSSGPDLALFVDVLGKQTALNRIDRALGQ